MKHKTDYFSNIDLLNLLSFTSDSCKASTTTFHDGKQQRIGEMESVHLFPHIH